MRFGLDVAQQRMPWDEVSSRVRFAEELGFDGAWGFDHFRPMQPSCNNRATFVLHSLAIVRFLI